MCWAYRCLSSHQGRHAPPSCLRTHHTWPLPGSIYDHSEADTASWPPSSSQCHYQCEHWSRSSFHPCYLWAARVGAPTQEKDGISLFNISFWTHLVSSHGLYPIILIRSLVLLSIPETLDSTGNNSGSTKARMDKQGVELITCLLLPVFSPLNWGGTIGYLPALTGVVKQ